MLSKFKRLAVAGLAAVGALVISVVVAVAGSAFVQYYGRKNYQVIEKYERQPYE